MYLNNRYYFVAAHFLLESCIISRYMYNDDGDLGMWDVGVNC